jgi:hypothetical protein
MWRSVEIRHNIYAFLMLSSTFNTDSKNIVGFVRANISVILAT